MEHRDCPDCGSHDNLAVYSDGTGYCFTLLENGKECGFKKDVENITPKTMDNNSEKAWFFHPNARFVPLKTRGISQDTCEHYRVSYADKKLYFPVYFEGRYISCKYKTPDKHFGWLQASSMCKLFGMNTVIPFKKTIIITEGELDALAAYQMYQGQRFTHNVVSVVSGAAGAIRDLSNHMEYLNHFDRIYICFDNDAPGRTAANACLDLFTPGKAYLVELPPGYKDANDMLLAEKEQEFREAVNQATTRMPKGMMTVDQQVQGAFDFLVNPDNRKGISTGIPSLDYYSGGLQKGMVFTVVGGTGTGKTRLVLDIAYNVSIKAKNPVNTYVFPLEMPYEHIMGLWLERYRGEPLISNPDYTPPLDSDEERLQLLEDIKHLSQHLHLHDCSATLNIDGVLNAITAAVNSKGARVIILDHKDQACVNEGNYDYKTIDRFMASLQALAADLKVTIIVVSHQSRADNDKDDTKVSLNKIRGSSGAAQNSAFVLGLERPRTSQYMTCKVLKAHRLIGRFGEFTLYRDTERFEYVEPNDCEAQNTEVKEISQPVRSVPSPGTGGQADIRTGEDTLHEDVHTGLPADNSDGETDIHRSEGLLQTERPNQDAEGEGGTPGTGHKNCLSERKPATVPKYPEWTQLDVPTVG